MRGYLPDVDPPMAPRVLLVVGAWGRPTDVVVFVGDRCFFLTVVYIVVDVPPVVFLIVWVPPSTGLLPMSGRTVAFIVDPPVRTLWCCPWCRFSLAMPASSPLPYILLRLPWPVSCTMLLLPIWSLKVVLVAQGMILPVVVLERAIGSLCWLFRR
jgi:hypothetical protein